MGGTGKENGFFVTFEGAEGAGKSTQIKKLAEYIISGGGRAVCTREPGGTPLAEKLRLLVKGDSGGEPVFPETELLIIEAARAQHMRRVILPALDSGACVLCDRFYDSTSAYQGAGRGIGAEVISSLNRLASAGRTPDLTFFLDLEPELGAVRTAHREATAGEYDRFEMEKMDFHRRVYAEFRRLAEAEPDRIKLIDASREADDVAAEIRRIFDDAR